MRSSNITAQAAGEIDAAEDAEQLAFEIDAMLLMANAAYVMEPERRGA